MARLVAAVSLLICLVFGCLAVAEEDGQAGPAPQRRDHWAFQKPRRPGVPSVKAGWGRNAIDAFVAAEHTAKGIEPLGEAERPVLLRRVYLDLIGLPPTREELQAYLSDTSSDAYEKVVDRLLASPQYGERWGRHWMDVWRYSDWYGRRAVPDVMNSYPHIWRWRDWIVRSLNEDKGYDRMVQEMLAADEIAPGDDANVVATGFIVRNWFKWNYEQWMKDTVEHTGKAFLALTLNCAHCHDHKYDPIKQEEYFRFRAFFEPLELRQDRVAGLADPGPFEKYVYAKSYGPTEAGLIRVFDEKVDAPTYMYALGDARNRMEGKPPVLPGVPQSLGGGELKATPVELPAEAYYPGLRAFIREEEGVKAEKELAAAREGLGKAKEGLAAAERQLGDVRAQSAQPVTAAVVAPADAIIKAERALLDARLSYRVDEAQVAAAEGKQRALAARIAADDAKYRGVGDAAALARAAFVGEKQTAYEAAQLGLARAERALVAAERMAAGDEKAKAEAAKAQQQLAAGRAAVDAARGALATVSEGYTPLSPVYPSKSTGRRAALARWIASAENPLTARVAVNHLWLRHFGRAIVETTANFGRNGRPPSHPELLDWLAVELMENGWKMKHVHRLMVTSQTYRLRSQLGGAEHPNVALDRDNRLYWRFNTRRMEAEAVRDSVLHCAADLDTTLGGQEIDHALGLKSRRRSLYFAIHGEAKMQFLDLFDGPNVCDCYQRSTSVLPQQALAMANSELLLKESRGLAGKLWAGTEGQGDGDAWFVRAAFEQILSRAPTEQEQRLSSGFLAKQATLFETAKQESDTNPSTDGTVVPSAEPAQRARENLIHALFSHNDFVTIR